MPDPEVCFEIYTSYSLREYIPIFKSEIGIGAMVLGCVYLISALFTIRWIRQSRRIAKQGMEGAAMHVIFPIYFPYMWLSAISDILVALVILFVSLNYRSTNAWTPSVAIALTISFQHLVIEGIAFVLMQYGCGIQAVRNAAICALLWSGTTFVAILILYHYGDQESSFYVSFIWNWILLIFYFSLWLLPEKYLFRRPAVIYYARFWGFIRLLVIISDILYKYGTGSMNLTVSNCIYAVVMLPLMITLKPIILYKVLLLDSIWWQGLNTPSSKSKTFFRLNTLFSSHNSRHHSSTNPNNTNNSNSILSYLTITNIFRSNPIETDYQAVKTSSSTSLTPNQSQKSMSSYKYEQIKDPLLGVEVGFNEAQALAKEVDNIHHQGTIRLLNFAYLTLDSPTNSLLGAGSFSKVYSGRYKGHNVAIKMLFTQDLNPEVIKRCSNEAKILTEISPHPNVVHIYGVAVLPPSVCIVLEICHYGSLSDVLRGSSGQGTVRMPLNLSLADRMFLALGCAKGVQALHNYSSYLCHRDIKSFNFLIDSQLNAKIADLDLGEHYTSSNSPNNTTSSFHSRNSITSRDSSLQSNSSLIGLTSEYTKRGKESSRQNMNITWQAPEVLLGQGYTQKSDIYSLALVLWEIIASGLTVKKFFTQGNGANNSNSNNNSMMLHWTPENSLDSNSNSLTSYSMAYESIPYANCKTQSDVREQIVLGMRPSLSGFQLFTSSYGQSLSMQQSPSAAKLHKLSSDSNYSNQSSHIGNKLMVDSLYLEIITTNWQPDPMIRMSINEIIPLLEQCYANCLHRYIYETDAIVEYDKIKTENIKMNMLLNSSDMMTNNNNTLSNHFSLPFQHTHHHSHHTSSSSNVFSTSSSPLTSSPLGGMNSLRQRPNGMTMPSPELMETLNVLKGESSWGKLEDLTDSYLVITPEAPYYMLWATRKWSQLLGYFINDILAQEIYSLFQGPNVLFEKILTSILPKVTMGQVDHLMTPIYRRDGKELLVSIHFFPVYDSTRSDFFEEGLLPIPSGNDIHGYRPGKLSFSAKEIQQKNENHVFSSPNQHLSFNTTPSTTIQPSTQQQQRQFTHQLDSNDFNSWNSDERLTDYDDSSHLLPIVSPLVNTTPVLPPSTHVNVETTRTSDKETNNNSNKQSLSTSSLVGYKRAAYIVLQFNVVRR